MTETGGVQLAGGVVQVVRRFRGSILQMPTIVCWPVSLKSLGAMFSCPSGLVTLDINLQNKAELAELSFLEPPAPAPRNQNNGPD